jgi:hypothetical protein
MMTAFEKRGKTLRSPIASGSQREAKENGFISSEKTNSSLLEARRHTLYFLGSIPRYTGKSTCDCPS